ncbi:SRPBCC family protein [Steroidobacter sp. S1-65]|uniref:SRPBCC family protein n=1 Tax=Steroidobacter gossypii TaxID=2805490 RepID=A0ABS1WVM1_9GAMM|nr:SRPBCC family protein [Steroidobacter gossypii]MBM0105026.1 SRPBCC family protein [Steroidobacter gossypii]
MDNYIEKSINVRVPVHTAYNQWTQFEEFPKFMKGVKEIRQLDDTHVHWVAEIAGKHKEWDAEITEQVPDQRISWRSVAGTGNSGEVQFRPLGTSETEVRVRMGFEPESMVEKIGDALHAPDRRVEGDLERFKEFIESHGQESGAWRGEVHGGDRTA